MIRKYIPAIVLILAAVLSALAAVGVLAAAAAIWLSSYWGPLYGTLAAAGLLLLLALLFWGLSSLAIKMAGRRQKAAIGDAAHDIWRSHPGGIMTAAGVLVFLLVKRPALLTRLLGAAARSTATLVMLRRMF